MFTGIVEATGKVAGFEQDGGNLHLWIECPFAQELKIDQSVAHNGVCLTVVEISGTAYKVTAIQETLKRTNLGQLEPGTEVNLERCLLATARLDGHIVQGHVDAVASVLDIAEDDGSWRFTFRFAPTAEAPLVVEKGSICLNGVSLTVVDASPTSCSVALIPYTFEHTNFKGLRKGDLVNVEFDILGKYVQTWLERRKG